MKKITEKYIKSAGNTTILFLILILSACGMKVIRGNVYDSGITVDQKRAIVEELTYGGQYQKMATMLVEELKLDDNDPNKLYVDHRLCNQLAGIYTYHLIDFKKAFEYNALFKKHIDLEINKKMVERKTYQKLVEQYHYRQIYLYVDIPLKSATCSGAFRPPIPE